jgi:hypothetical protein
MDYKQQLRIMDDLNDQRRISGLNVAKEGPVQGPFFISTTYTRKFT